MYIYVYDFEETLYNSNLEFEREETSSVRCQVLRGERVLICSKCLRRLVVVCVGKEEGGERNVCSKCSFHTEEEVRL